MNAPVDIGIGVSIEGIHRFDHDLRFLRGSGRIEIHQLHPWPNFSAENGKILTDAINVKSHSGYTQLFLSYIAFL
jgi:hypothetical protein